ncbi:sodium:proton antiporter [Cesiribacter sp. SM1]|uniref:cation:proton antiporter n=1 Tax=Cesiribacter sp. SM1 TaxID=2861196 RepID=UPI001CD6097B|nr:sodium:proton antiporter [Cesiribacter sp. SM1]
MDIEEAFKAFEHYDLWLIIIGLAVLATAVLPRLLAKYPLTLPIVLLALGYAAIALPLGLKTPDPKEHGSIAEHLTELGVIIAIMGAGLNIDRKPSLKGWNGTWRLLTITMILSIALAALVGWWLAAFVPATAVLLGAVIAPTDPVLASEVQVGAPGEGSEDEETEDTDQTGHGEEDEVRFSLTSEAGLNDGLAFPFTNMAVAMALAGAHPSNWIETWLLMDVLYKLGVAAVIGLGLGYLLARVIFSMPAETSLAKSMIGLGALAATLLVYGVTQYLGGYGFIAVFLGAVVIRNYKRKHEYQDYLHTLTEKTERLLTALILLGLGGAIAGGLLEPLNWQLVVSALIIIFIVRPVAGIIGLIGFKRAPWRDRLAISFYGMRGIGSLYYLSFALNEEDFEGTEEIWALVTLVVVLSIFIHGITATPVTSKLDRLREQENGNRHQKNRK